MCSVPRRRFFNSPFIKFKLWKIKQNVMDCWTVFLVSFMMSVAAGTIPEISEFFPDIENDLSEVTWGHAINSKNLLNQALTNESFMMLEADVSKGHLDNETAPSRLIPIMAHPPHKSSDISLEMWIDQVIEANVEGKKIGVKLDFKELDIVLTSLEILRKKSELLNFPLWLNADILKGPGAEDSTPLDPDIFLSLCTEFFPDATLSLGWTTKYIPSLDLKYTNDMVEEMVNTLDRNNVDQPVTFPVRAAFVGASMESLENLYIDKPDYTFTVWTSSTDDVNIDDLAKFQTTIGSNAAFFDLSPEQMEQLDEAYEKQATAKQNTNASSSSSSSSFLAFTILCIAISLLGAHYFR